MSCPDVDRFSWLSRRVAQAAASSLALVCVVVPGCGKDHTMAAETTSSSSTTGEPPPEPCDHDTPCADDAQLCLNGFCYDGPPPTVTITSPVDQMQLPWDAASMTQPVTVTVQGSGLTLVAAADNPEAVNGSGQVVLTLDNFVVATIESGDLEAGIPIEVETDALAGAHRLHAFAQQSDGTAYDNPESSFNSLFWFDDGLPHVAFDAPLPGEKFTTGGQQIQVKVGVINFSLSPAAGEALPGKTGIVLMHEDQMFPACAADEACRDAGAIDVLAPMQETYEVTKAVMIHDASGAKTKLTALLARTDRSPYCLNDADPCVPVYETITIGRMDPVEDPSTTSGGADTTGTGTGTGTTTGG